MPYERVPKALNASGSPVIREEEPKALRRSDRWSILRGDDAIEFIDITNCPLREYPSPFYKLARDPKDTKVDVGGKVLIIL